MASPLSPERARRQRPTAAGGPTPDVAAALGRYRETLLAGLRATIQRAREDGLAHADDDAATRALVEAFYGQMEYHFGWRAADLTPAATGGGKLLRPTLLLLGVEMAASRSGGAEARARAVERALPAALAVELVHNFSLIHDDIEDGDEARHHRPTLWRLWGQPQAINTGDAMFALARLALFGLLERRVPATLVARLARLLDRTCARLCEGQHLDMSFEGRRDVTIAMYLAMIERKTAALMECALEMGARLGGADEPGARRLGDVGRALGLGFQLRDDLLGIWAARAVLGKDEAGDLRRRKMSLPVIHALERGAPEDREALLALYAGDDPVDDERVAWALRALERTGAREQVRAVLHEQCARARAELARAAGDSAAAAEPRALLGTLVDYVAAEVA